MEKFGKYQVVEELASGDFGAVYKGYDPMIKRSVAIKTCSAKDEVTRRRFELEVEIAGNLHHQNITTVYDYGLKGETPYLIQELLDGEDLDRKLERREEISIADKLSYLLQIARAMAHSHRQGVLHRDLHPGNIHILPDGTVKIMDFGVARFLHQESVLTAHGQRVGTTAYLSPEQILSKEPDERVDVFGFGTLAYELLTCEPAFRGSSISTTLSRILEEAPEPIPTYWPECPGKLARLIEHCLEKDPERRPAGFGEIVAELERIHRAMLA